MTGIPDVRDNSEKQQFEIVIGDAVALAQYALNSDVIRFTHTEVPASLSGRGLSKVLVKAGLKSARERGLKVQPSCSVFAKYIAEHPEEQDILHPNYRERLGL